MRSTLISSTGWPKRMLSNVIAVLSYTDQSARSCSVSLSMVRLMPDSASGSAPDRLPGFSPQPCTLVPPCRQAASTRSRSPEANAVGVEQECRRHDVLAAGQDRAHLVDRRSAAGCTPRSPRRGRGPGRRRSWPATPTGSRPIRVPASTPSLSSEYTLTPTNSSPDARIEDRRQRLLADRARAPLDDAIVPCRHSDTSAPGSSGIPPARSGVPGRPARHRHGDDRTVERDPFVLRVLLRAARRSRRPSARRPRARSPTPSARTHHSCVQSSS